MAAIHESFKGCQHYELSASKILQDTVDRPAKKKAKKKTKVDTDDGEKSETTSDQLIPLTSENTSKETRDESEAEEKDSVALLNEILGGLSVDEGDFSQEWTEVFGDCDDRTGAASGKTPESSQQKENAFFLPSQLLDQRLNDLQSPLSDWSGIIPPLIAQETEHSSGANQNPPKPAVKETAGKSNDLSAWFNLFADLDPLSNPDAIGKPETEHELHTA